MTCNCRSSGECWHFSKEEWAEMAKEAAKYREELKVKEEKAKAESQEKRVSKE